MSSRTLAKAHWIVCVSLLELQQRETLGAPSTQITAVLRRFLKEAHRLDPTDHRFPVELAGSYLYATELSGAVLDKKSVQFRLVQEYSERALAIEENHPTALSLIAWIREQ